MSHNMTIPVNDLSRRHAANSDRHLKKITDVIKSGKWIQGPEHSAFEMEFAKYLSTDFLLGVASGTDALELALRAAGCTKNSNVITVANAGGYSSIAAVNIGCNLIYCDVESEYGLIDLSALRELVSPNIDAVVVTHLFGNIAPIDDILELCKPFDIKVIEDCAQAVGGTKDDLPVGSFGDIGTFSFYPTKNLGAIGDAGAVATSNAEYAQRISELRQYGWRGKYQIHTRGGINSRLDEIQAAILRIELTELDVNIRRRREIVMEFEKEIKKTPIRLLTRHSEGSAPHLAVVALPNGVSRANFREFLSQRGVQTDIHYPVLDCDQPGLFKSPRNEQIPVSRALSDVLVTLPLFPGLTPLEIDIILSSISEYSNKFLR